MKAHEVGEDSMDLGFDDGIDDDRVITYGK